MLLLFEVRAVAVRRGGGVSMLGAGICPQPAVCSVECFIRFPERHSLHHAAIDKQPFIALDGFRFIAPNKAVEVNSLPLRRLYFHRFLARGCASPWVLRLKIGQRSPDDITVL